MNKLAKWWLDKQGYLVVAPDFFGVIVGSCHAVWQSPPNQWAITTGGPSLKPPIIGVNGAVIEDGPILP